MQIQYRCAMEVIWLWVFRLNIMHKFSTSSGKPLWYDVKNNRIDIWTPERESEVSPIVHFKAPTTITANKITMFTIEMTQQCNLRCSYCCFSGDYRDRRAHKAKEISYETLQKTVDYIKGHYDKEAEEITICFLWRRGFTRKKENRMADFWVADYPKRKSAFLVFH